MSFLALNVWTGSPLLAVWIGSRVQGEESQPSIGAYAIVIVALVAFSVGLYQLLKAHHARVPGGDRHHADGTNPRAVVAEHAR